MQKACDYLLLALIITGVALGVCFGNPAAWGLAGAAGLAYATNQAWPERNRRPKLKPDPVLTAQLEAAPVLTARDKRPYLVAYVAGPYRHRTLYGLQRNIRLAEAVAAQLWTFGFAVLCPHKNTALLDGLLPDRAWLEGDLSLLQRSDLLVMMPEWQKSNGSRYEHEFAKVHGIPIYYWERSADRAILKQLGATSHPAGVWF